MAPVHSAREAVVLDVTSALVPANNKWYRGLTKLTVAGNRWFESTSLQGRVYELSVRSAGPATCCDMSEEMSHDRVAKRPKRGRRFFLQV